MRAAKLIKMKRCRTIEKIIEKFYDKKRDGRQRFCHEVRYLRRFIERRVGDYNISQIYRYKKNKKNHFQKPVIQIQIRYESDAVHTS